MTWAKLSQAHGCSMSAFFYVYWMLVFEWFINRYFFQLEFWFNSTEIIFLFFNNTNFFFSQQNKTFFQYDFFFPPSILKQRNNLNLVNCFLVLRLLPAGKFQNKIFCGKNENVYQENVKIISFLSLPCLTPPCKICVDLLNSVWIYVLINPKWYFSEQIG